jgi:hypothetical protein
LSEQEKRKQFDHNRSQQKANFIRITPEDLNPLLQKVDSRKRNLKADISG